MTVVPMRHTKTCESLEVVGTKNSVSDLENALLLRQVHVPYTYSV